MQKVTKKINVSQKDLVKLCETTPVGDKLVVEVSGCVEIVETLNGIEISRIPVELKRVAELLALDFELGCVENATQT